MLSILADSVAGSPSTIVSGHVTSVTSMSGSGGSVSASVVPARPLLPSSVSACPCPASVSTTTTYSPSANAGESGSVTVALDWYVPAPGNGTVPAFSTWSSVRSARLPSAGARNTESDHPEVAGSEPLLRTVHVTGIWAPNRAAAGTFVTASTTRSGPRIRIGRPVVSLLPSYTNSYTCPRESVLTNRNPAVPRFAGTVTEPEPV